MDGVGLAVVGALLVAMVVVDLLDTTLTITGGAGFLTRRVVALAWRGLLRVHRPDSRSPVLLNAGAGLLVLTFLVWVTLLWAGWSLVFLAGGAVVEAQSGAPASPADVVYYTGFTIFTLGVGDFTAEEASWRILTAVASASGLVVVTLAVTYLLSVVSAVVARRSLAGYVHGLGDTAGDIVARGWAGDAFSSAFVQHLVAITAQVTTVAEQHLAYPVLHYFRSRRPANSAPVALARLDDAILLLQAAVAESARPASAAVEPLRRVLDRYVEAAHATSASPHDGGPPGPPCTGALVRAGIPSADPDEWERQVAAQAGRRARLRQLVAGAGWSWPDG